MSPGSEGLVARLRQPPPAPLDLALSVAPGEVVAILGRSGAGKTSLLHAIAGLTRRCAGNIAVGGETWLDDAERLPPHRRRIGMLFQHFALFPHMTAAQNLLAAMDAPDADEARRLLERVGLSGFADRRPAQLSGGERQRVALARALARRPRLLLLDEPFSAVDRPTRRALADTIAEVIAGLGAPVLLVSHDVEDVARLASRVIVMDDGRIVQQGSIARLRAAPLNDLVLSLL